MQPPRGPRTFCAPSVRLTPPCQPFSIEPGSAELHIFFPSIFLAVKRIITPRPHLLGGCPPSCPSLDVASSWLLVRVGAGGASLLREPAGRRFCLDLLTPDSHPTPSDHSERTGRCWRGKPHTTSRARRPRSCSTPQPPQPPTATPRRASMCIIERSRSAHSMGSEALEQGDAERAVESLSEGIKTASEDDHHKVGGCVRWLCLHQEHDSFVRGGPRRNG